MALSCTTCYKKNDFSIYTDIMAPFIIKNDKFNQAIAISLRKIPQNNEFWFPIKVNNFGQPTTAVVIGMPRIDDGICQFRSSFIRPSVLDM